MAARKLQQEVDKCFKKVTEGVGEFESIYDKIEQATNAAQKEKQEDNLKREIKKLQRLRDQIKTWAAGNEIKDKGPLLEHRRLIETQMEKFKAVEKAMKTKAYSKEGLSAQTKLDPKEQAKEDAIDFLSQMVDTLQEQIETLETEAETIQATVKKGKATGSKADKIAGLESKTERHKWHQGKLELIKRSLENGAVDAEQVTALEEDIKYYVAENMGDDFMEDEEIYDQLNLDEEEDAYGMNNDAERGSSQDNHSVNEDEEVRSSGLPAAKPKFSSGPDLPAGGGRRPSTQLKSPLPALATLSTTVNGPSAPMKPAAVPTRPAGEPLKYASAAAAAAASVGIAPLPPPPGAAPPGNNTTSLPPLPPPNVPKSRTTSDSPVITTATTVQADTTSVPAARKSYAAPVHMSSDLPAAVLPSKSPTPTEASTVNRIHPTAILSRPAAEVSENVRSIPSRASSGMVSISNEQTGSPIVLPSAPSQKSVFQNVEATPASATNGISQEINGSLAEDHDESIYHLPSGLQDLVQSFEMAQKRATNIPSRQSHRMTLASHSKLIAATDTEAPKDHRQRARFSTPAYYPQELHAMYDNPKFFAQLDPDTLFYTFYYKQASYQQYLAAKALKDSSWRFHKQYQTWFQRHEEPKVITEEYEQGTYRFFDYESTWMNRRKADFKFAYKFLEDDV